MKHVRQMHAYTDPGVGFIQTRFYYSYQFHGDTKLNENIIQVILTNIIIRFLYIYEELVHCFVVFHFFLIDMANAEHVIVI
jgi:hypothetical protein